MSRDGWLARAPVKFTAAEIADAIARVAAEISPRCAGRDPLVITVMMGGMPFAAALLPLLACPLQQDYAQLSRYRGEVRGGATNWLHHPSASLVGRQVLLLDDVLDDGETLAVLRKWCLDAGAAEVLSAVLVRKRSARRPQGLEPDFAGLEAGPGYLFGFGMDYRERYRNLPEIRVLPVESVDE